MYYHYGSDLAKMVADELSISPLERSTLSHQEFDILEQCRKTIQTFAKKYPDKPEVGFFDEGEAQYFQLIKVMGITKPPYQPLFPRSKDKHSLTEFQKIGWCVKLGVDKELCQASYAGSFMINI
ncbi:predicted protein [Naegleria gruberi]|uniref:Predicted protein n=1 Tax=Naegleria gruberi TaxID=5762 RepID=D2W124_NAEGR|nr:uncharacterized protein NAEGRDRAFT_75063 [Naegleria gruberi]EFC37240.1 predicted protein [Naegleria gruberi]|eukprot:XP_002669984.1 predicted protein [Naegleria gruberi strain NEG-M]